MTFRRSGQDAPCSGSMSSSRLHVPALLSPKLKGCSSDMSDSGEHQVERMQYFNLKLQAVNSQR